MIHSIAENRAKFCVGLNKLLHSILLRNSHDSVIVKQFVSESITGRWRSETQSAPCYQKGQKTGRVHLPIILSNIFIAGRRQSKTSVLSTNVDDKWQVKTLFLSIFIRVRRLLRAFSIAAYPV